VVAELPEGVGFTAVATASARADEVAGDVLAEAIVHEVGDVGRTELLGGVMAVRTDFVDVALAEAAARQVVLVGAGLDGRAYRLRWRAGSVLFELDSPSVLAFKRAVAARAGLEPSVRTVPVGCDLADGVEAPLLGAGFDPALPTAWVLEGVLNYLSVEAADALVSRLAALSAPGSTAVMTWIDPVAERLLAAARSGAAADRTVQAARAAGPADEPARWLPRHGWEPAVTTTLGAWAARLGREIPRFLHERRGGGRCWLVAARA
jgi:methyltransferase (TIGR00027 family)